MRLEDSLLMTMSCLEVSSASYMACDEPWIGMWILGDDAYLASIEVNQMIHSYPSKSGAPITQSAWLVDSVFGISECEDDAILDEKLQQAFELPSAFNSLIDSSYAEIVRERCGHILKSSYEIHSGLFVIKRDSNDRKIVTPNSDADFFDGIRERNAIVKSFRDNIIETLLGELNIGFTAVF